jgi:hypothetical protein
VFFSFLALMLQKDLADPCRGHGLVIEWADLLRDLARLQEVTIEKHGKAITARTTVAGHIGSVFEAAGITLPPNLHQRRLTSGKQGNAPLRPHPHSRRQQL